MNEQILSLIVDKVYQQNDENPIMVTGGGSDCANGELESSINMFDLMNIFDILPLPESPTLKIGVNPYCIKVGDYLFKKFSQGTIWYLIILKYDEKTNNSIDSNKELNRKTIEFITKSYEERFNIFR